MQSFVLRWIFIALVAIGTAIPASAYLPHDSSMYEIPLMSDQFSMPYEELAQKAEIAKSTDWTQFKSSIGQGWEVFLWNEATATPQFAAGQPIQILSSGTYSERTVLDATDQFLSDIGNLLRLESDDLQFQSIRVYGEKAWVHYGQLYQGLPVFNTQIGVHLENGGINAVSPDIYPDINISTTPAFDETAATMYAREGLPWNYETDTVDEQITLGVLPMIWEKSPAYFLVYKVILRTTDPAGEWFTYVDAFDGTIHWRENQHSFYTITGETRGDTQPRHATDDWEDLSQPNQIINVDGQTYYSDEDGQIDAYVSNNQSYTVTAQNRGRYVRVVNTITSDVAETSVSASPSSPAEIYWDETNTSPAERDCYYHTNLVHSWVKSIDPDWTSMDQPVTCSVNKTSGSCNAYASGNSINFYNQGGGCVNTGQMADVIYHEYHHVVTGATYAPSQPPTPSGMNEGFSDYCTMALTGNPCMAPGMYTTQPDNCMREGTNMRQYPGSECSGEVHCLGEITMGVLWKTKVNLMEKYGPEYAHEADITFREMMLAKPYYITHMGQKFLMANDDNGDLTDGTPDYWEIHDAYSMHGIPLPSITKKIVFDHTPIADTPSTNSILISAEVTTAGGAGSIVSDSTMIYYTLDGVNYNTVPMTNAGGNTYQGYIPAGNGLLVDYYLRSVTDQDIVGTDPLRAPGVYRHQFLMGAQDISLDDDLESDLGWTIGAPDDDASDGLWERANPEGKMYGDEMIQPEDDHTSGGSLCFVTDARGGYWSNYDVDHGKTSLISPPLDLTGSAGGYIEFWAFLSNGISFQDDSLSCHISNDGTNWHPFWVIYGDDWNDGFSHHKVYFRDNEFGFTDTVYFRFECEDNENNTTTEAALDDIKVVVARDMASTDETRPVLSFRVNRPEPSVFSHLTSVRFQIPAQQDVSVAVYDVAGRMVRTLIDDEMKPGDHHVQWDGSTDRGLATTSGVYFIKVASGNRQMTRSVILAR